MIQKLHALLTKKNVTYAIVILLVLSLVLAYPFRGIIRSDMLPSMTRLVYGPGLSSATNDSRREVQNAYPFGQIKYITEYKPSCQLSDAHHFETEIYCSTYLFRGQTSIKGTAIDDFEQKAKILGSALKQKGWSSTYANGELTRSYGSPYGWWYFAEYEKMFGKNDCQLTIQRDNDPALLDAEISCDHIVTLF